MRRGQGKNREPGAPPASRQQASTPSAYPFPIPHKFKLVNRPFPLLNSAGVHSRAVAERISGAVGSRTAQPWLCPGRVPRPWLVHAAPAHLAKRSGQPGATRMARKHFIHLIRIPRPSGILCVTLCGWCSWFMSKAVKVNEEEEDKVAFRVYRGPQRFRS